jgi:hypothetical protein
MAYRVLVGIDYPPDKRADAGDVVNDLPPKSVRWLLAQGIIEDTSGKPTVFPPEEEEVETDPEDAAPDASTVTDEDGE